MSFKEGILTRRRNGAASFFAPLRRRVSIFCLLSRLPVALEVLPVRLPSSRMNAMGRSRSSILARSRLLNDQSRWGFRGIRLNPDRTRVWVAISYPTNESQGEDKIAELDLKGNVIAKYEAGTDPENFVVNDHATRLYIANEDAGTASITTVKANRDDARRTRTRRRRDESGRALGVHHFRIKQQRQRHRYADRAGSKAVSGRRTPARGRFYCRQRASLCDRREWKRGLCGRYPRSLGSQDYQSAPRRGLGAVKTEGRCRFAGWQARLCRDRAGKQRRCDRRRELHIDHLDFRRPAALGHRPHTGWTKVVHRKWLVE